MNNYDLSDINKKVYDCTYGTSLSSLTTSKFNELDAFCICFDCMVGVRLDCLLYVIDSGMLVFPLLVPISIAVPVSDSNTFLLVLFRTINSNKPGQTAAFSSSFFFNFSPPTIATLGIVLF